MANKRVEETQKASGRRKPLPGKRTTPVSDLPSLREEHELPSSAAGQKGSFPIVGIGASAGGLDAFERFFRAIPPDSGMAFILISHLNPSQKSLLPELIQRFTKMPVVEAAEGTEVKPNQVYIIPPNWDLSIKNRKFELNELPENRALMRPVDSFFRSLARDLGENAISIILSGTGTEGSLGLKAVKGEGGLVLAQDPKDAAFDGMPASAIATGFVDAILPASRMPRLLQNYWAHLRKLTPPPPYIDHLQQIYKLIRSHTGQDFSLYRRRAILRRIEQRMALHKIVNIRGYANYLQDNIDEIEILCRELMIRVTSFFRDREAFEALKKIALPLITGDKSQERPVRVWVAGCSTGEEAYSLAIILHEYALKARKSFKTQIFATDIDKAAIDIARAGEYADDIAMDVSPERLRLYFTKQGDVYTINREIREMVSFAVHNLLQDPPFSKLDLLSCRNLLIYLEPELQKKIPPLFYRALNPEGVLFLGPNESLGEAAAAFSILDGKWKIFQTRKKK